MIRPYTTSVPSLLLGCLFSPLLLADDPPLELKQQIISAPSVESTTVADMAQYGSKVEIVTREQIERAGPAADVSRVMQMFIPGLYVAPKNGPFDYGTYSLLGGRNDDTLILLDGVRLKEARTAAEVAEMLEQLRAGRPIAPPAAPPAPAQHRWWPPVPQRAQALGPLPPPAGRRSRSSPECRPGCAG